MLRALAELLRPPSGRKRPSPQPYRGCRLRVEDLEDRRVLSPAVPAYSSLPGAPESLYLDFDGHTQADWGTQSNGQPFHPGTTPAFDLDGNPGTFSAAETAAVREIWQRVAEDYAPFNLNVTTVQPTHIGDQEALRVVIGGSWNDWYHVPCSGVSVPGSFTSASQNVVYVFSGDIARWAETGGYDGDGRPIQVGAAVATTASHEAGHAFGLYHQSLYDASGNKIDEYNPGSATRTPIMGSNLSSDRTTWSDGTTLTATTTQDDMAVIAGSANGFGYRPDDHANSWSGATPLGGSPRPGLLSGSGVIEKTTDGDWFAFTAGSGQASFKLSTASVGANLDAKLSLYRAPAAPGLLPTLVASADPGDELGASLTAALSAGTYYLKVSSHGSYGDVGQYSLLGSVAPGVSLPLASGALPPAAPDTKGLAEPTRQDASDVRVVLTGAAPAGIDIPTRAAAALPAGFADDRGVVRVAEEAWTDPVVGPVRA